MTKENNRRTINDRRDSEDKRSEEFIKYFIPKEEEKRDGKDRRKSNSGTD